MIYLPDVNVWVALASDKHIHHSVAKHWFSGTGSNRVAFCRVTEMGLLRLLTNRHVMSDDTVTPKVAWQIYDALRADRQVIFLDEPPGFSERWRLESRGLSGGPNMWTDVYLSVFASTYQANFVTFDRALSPNLHVQVLGPVPNF
jgi:toxin-antitoxin system PIN domain toxin